MKGKKVLKALGIAALLASVVPYRVEKDDEKDELTVQALLWKVTNYPHPDFEDQRTTSLSIGFHPPVLDDCDCCFDDDCCCEEPCGCEAPVEADCCCEDAPAAEPCGCGCEETPADESSAE